MSKQAKKLAKPKAPNGNTEGLAADCCVPGSSFCRRAGWGSEGMPLRKQRRYVETTPEDSMPGWESRRTSPYTGTDLAAELRRGLSFVRDERLPKAKRK